MLNCDVIFDNSDEELAQLMDEKWIRVCGAFQLISATKNEMLYETLVMAKIIEKWG